MVYRFFFFLFSYGESKQQRIRTWFKSQIHPLFLVGCPPCNLGQVLFPVGHSASSSKKISD